MPHKPGHKKENLGALKKNIQKTDEASPKFRGSTTQGKGPGTRQELVPADPGQPGFIPAAEAQERIALLKARGAASGEGLLPDASLAGGQNFTPETLRRLAEVIQSQEAEVQLPIQGDQVQDVVPQQQAQAQEGLQPSIFKQSFQESVLDPLGRGAPGSVGEAIGDVALVGTGGVAGGGVQGVGGVIRGATGVRAGLQAGKATRSQAEIFKLGRVRVNAVVDLLKGNTGKGLTTAERAINRELSTKKIAQILRVKDAQAIRAVNSYNLWSKSRITNFLSKKPVKTTLKVGGAFAGTDVILTWYALDNVATGMPFMIPTIDEAVSTGNMTTEEALATFNEAEIAYELALNKAEISARINPLLWPSSKLITQGAALDRVEYELKKQNFLNKFGL